MGGRDLGPDHHGERAGVGEPLARRHYAGLRDAATWPNVGARGAHQSATNA